MLRRVFSWSSVAGFLTAAGYFWQKGDLEIALAFVGILVSIVPFLFHKPSAANEKSSNSRLKSFFQGQDFRKKYFTLLQYQHRDFDIKGLSTQTIHTLDLEQVFVELKLQPQVAHNTSSDPLSRKPNKLRSDSFPIWHFFSLLAEDEKMQNAKIAIVGPPGSGKTTLLKHIALLLTHSNKQGDLPKLKFNKIPTLLFLRDHVKDILDDPSILLPRLVETTITKWDIPVPSGWFHKKLKEGNCLVMLDGLDEVADLQARHRIVSWMEKQIQAYPKNTFIVTSR